MTKRILTTKFNYSMPTDELKKIMPLVAPDFSKIPGCIWKIWLLEENPKVAGGVYLFESAEDLERFLKSDLFKAVSNNPAFSNLQANTFGVEGVASVITRAPLKGVPV